MIVDSGKIWIKQYLAAQQGSIANSIGLGVGGTTVATTDTAMALEVARVPVLLTSYDFATNQIVFKGSIPDDLAATIYEVGLFSGSEDAAVGLITTFDSDVEVWSTPVSFASTAHRAGSDSLRQNPAASGTVTNSLSELNLDLADYAGSDLFQFAYNVEAANVPASAQVRFQTDTSNYYAFNMPTPTSGYKISEIAKSAASVVGAPSWDDITGIYVSTTSAGGGAGTIDWDVIRVREIDPPNSDNILVARQLLTTPTAKTIGKVQDVEVRVAVTI